MDAARLRGPGRPGEGPPDNTEVVMNTRTLERRCRIAAHLGISTGFFAFLFAFTGCTPDVSDMRYEGVSQYRSRQYTESMATMREVLEKAPNDAQANYYMGMNY